MEDEGGSIFKIDIMSNVKQRGKIQTIIQNHSHHFYS